jgi:hypothetical protein
MSWMRNGAPHGTAPDWRNARAREPGGGRVRAHVAEDATRYARSREPDGALLDNLRQRR